MKLRNKKTGDAVYVDFQIPLSNNNEVLGTYSVTSLKELNESFEDYIPTEPLIKDEKIRKAVRAWAEVEGIEDCRYVVPDTFENIGGTSKIEFGAFGFDEGQYTIDELCGGEEE